MIRGGCWRTRCRAGWPCAGSRRDPPACRSACWASLYGRVRRTELCRTPQQARSLGAARSGPREPALFRGFADTAHTGAFTDEAHWAANEPLRQVDRLHGVPMGVWCGTEDPFVDAARELIDRVHPKLAAIGPGAHENAYWWRVLPDMLRFIGEHLP